MEKHSAYVSARFDFEAPTGQEGADLEWYAIDTLLGLIHAGKVAVSTWPANDEVTHQ